MGCCVERLTINTRHHPHTDSTVVVEIIGIDKYVKPFTIEIADDG